MTVRCRYETVMALGGIPSELRSIRNVIGKRTGYFELTELPDRNVVPAGSISGQAAVPNVKYHAAVDGSGLFQCEGALDNSTFDGPSSVSVVRARLEKLKYEIGRLSKTDVVKTFYPADLAHSMNHYMVSAARVMQEFNPSDYREFDSQHYDFVHEKHAAALAAYVACDRMVYLPEPMPFIAVFVEAKIVQTKVFGAEVAGLGQRWLGCVRIFQVADSEEASAYAAALADREGFELREGDFTIELERPEFFSFDIDAAQFRMTAERMLATYVTSLKGYSMEHVALERPLEELVLARNLKAAIEDTDRRTSIHGLEAAVTACMDYEEVWGLDRFSNRRDMSCRILIEEWRDRVVGVEFGSPKFA